MADRFSTLLDITQRNGTDAAIGLVEEVTTYAPEIDEIMGRTIKGTTFKTKKRITLPTGPAFRNANEGSYIVSSAYEQTIAQCFILDAQMRVDKCVADADEDGASAFLADEASGVVKEKMIALGDQFYRGTTADAKGFAGLASLYDSTNMEVSATGNSGSATSAWLVFNDLKGIHFIFGNDSGLNMGDWSTQQVTDSNSKAYTAYVNSLCGWIGLAICHTKSIARIKLITTDKPLTDSLVAQALSKFPVGMKPNKMFINRNAAFWLQRSRSTVSSSKTDSALLQFAPQPTESQGIPIVITDSIPTTE